ncbi:sugar transferase [Bacillus thuringiensis]|uniref:Sugar transferase n=2 Tax=Bacillus cereus group TaxID=86661 RepID=A0A9X6V6D7_BACTU|nr:MULTISPECIES: sugar transferase [Bacillus]MCT6901797.1 sugar transferase [Lactobacillus sp.]AJQ62000.1 UDP-phosphate N-acetylgalactosaminyl-1-phosphate transferase [Bacillus thuringiensis serovar morrisoni]AMR87742.1 UDP-phosphate N-acetylgalactosaminyl-1-phosphate transferase [Bacillus thuringiensis]EOO31371.1 exopolysaccharide biosynthesis polyprenyl glycosylphosphotransferase [Bacillus cereus BAG1X1-1]EOO45366.1 exopolysaccharide biosynthesis polyprenyl glycosylphosphotransferase [Bacill
MAMREMKKYPLDETIETNINLPNHYIYFTLKNTADFLMALLGLVILSPILLLFVLAIKLESNGPAFFLQERVGLNGRVFNIIKLRSMYIDAEKNGAQWAKKNDARVTKIGAFIRRTRIDEIPQLINMLKGDMSLVGPRPERPIFTEQFNKEIPGFKNRIVVKPGITGWAQVNGGYDISPKEKLEFDIYYIKNLSLFMDVKIIFKTIKVIFTGEGAR